MPSCQTTSFAEKLVHAKALCRFAVSRGNLDSIWDAPTDKELFESFVSRCVHEADMDLQSLLMIHDHELVMLFDEFQLHPSERCTIRRYLNLPEDALWILWTAAKISLVCVASAFRMSRRLIGVPGIVLLSVGAGVGLAGRSVRCRLVAEAHKIVEQHRERRDALAAMLQAETASVAQQHRSPHPQRPPIDRSNPFFDPDDLKSLKTPRYPVPRFAHYDFGSGGGSQPRERDGSAHRLDDGDASLLGGGGNCEHTVLDATSPALALHQ